MAKIKANSKKSNGSTAWGELQREYSQTAKGMFERISNQMKSTKHYQATAVENHKKKLARLKVNVVVDVVKSIASLQSQFVEQTFEDINAITRGFISKKPGKTADSFVHLDVMKGSLQRAMEHADNVESIFSNSRKEICDRMNDRFDEVKKKMKSRTNKRNKK